MACGSCGARLSRKTFEHTSAKGKVTVYASEVEARAAVVRSGGNYVKK